MEMEEVQEAEEAQEAEEVQKRTEPRRRTPRKTRGKLRQKLRRERRRKKKRFVEPDNGNHPPATHTIGELSEALRKSRQTVARAIASGQIQVLPLTGEHQRVSHREFLRLTGLAEPLPE